VELSRLRQLAWLFTPTKTLLTYHKPYVCKKHDSQQVGFSGLFYSEYHSLLFASYLRIQLNAILQALHEYYHLLVKNLHCLADVVRHNVFRRNEFGRNVVLGAAKPWSDPDPITACRMKSVLLGDIVFIAILRIERWS
jgi:hypothetical protein